ncbi:hypothetical protein DFH09DRAFT_1304918 [Mycena vulgaris]|nr:hypothetical protein DFH09DRAFT_1304918 [Mycena vulgaris]
MPKDTTHPQAPGLAPRNGDTIGRTAATNKYRLGVRDLDSLLPVSVKPHGKNEKKDYNLNDVIALDARLNSAIPGPSERTPENGPQMMRFEAMNEFKLQSAQMDRITPVSEIPHPKNGKGPIRVYNRCDVVALDASVTAAAAAAASLCGIPPAPTPSIASGSAVPISSTNTGPSSRKRPVTTKARSRRAVRAPRPIEQWEDHNMDDDPNIFDGMDHDDAAALFAQLTSGRW